MCQDFRQLFFHKIHSHIASFRAATSSMDTFLKEKAQEIFNRHGDQLQDVRIIIPNKRAAVHLQHHLSEIIQRPFFAPEILTIDEWIDLHTNERIADSSELIFHLYDAYVRVETTSADSFNDFLKWGYMMLTDFDEIDRYLVQPKEIFTDLKNIKDIENWSFGEEELSGGQQEFLNFWGKLPVYYEAFNKLLNSHQITYRGRAYQNFLNKLEQLPDEEHYYFIGFNALSNAEEKIIHKLMLAKRATVYFDMDRFYTENEDHEAGHFYRSICNRWGQAAKSDDYISTIDKKIEIIESSSQIGQVKIAGTLVQELLESEKILDQTAIVLADESLFTPLIRSLPSTLDKANVTMGYPLQFTQLQSLLNIIFELQTDLIRSGKRGLYHQSLLGFLDHQYIRASIEDKSKLNSFVNDIIEFNRVYVEPSDLLSNFPELIKIEGCVNPWNNISLDGSMALGAVGRFLLASEHLDKKLLDQQIVQHFMSGLERFEKLLSTFKPDLDLRAFERLFERFWQAESLSFFGNPINGLQIMGILETRTIDFKHLIILGVNEGSLPKTNPTTSFIPWDLRRKSGLPLDEDRQAIYAHHFYRLLHRAETISITYNSTADNNSSGEKSRYIFQLEHELKTSSGHQISRRTFTPDDQNSVTTKTVYENSEAIRQRISEKLERGLSPSAFNTLIECPLNFYYRYILGLGETAKVEESFEASTFGTKIHAVLDDIFKRRFLDAGIPLDADILREEKKNLSNYLLSEYTKDHAFRTSDIEYGYNKLAFDVSVRFLEQFIDAQIKEIDSAAEPIEILMLEQELKASYEWEIGGKKRKVVFAGIADRVDKIGNRIRIIDYKSGKCTWDNVGIPSSVLKNGFKGFITHKDKRYARQLLLYALMFRQGFSEYQHYTAGIISMININSWLQNVRIDEKSAGQLDEEILNEFESSVQEFLQSFFQEDFVFEHNTDALYCEHCEN